MNFRITLVAAGLLATANIAVATLLPARCDWTRQREFTLSPQTSAVLNRLAAPASVLVLAAREPRTAAERGFEPARLMLRELLPLYARAPSLISFRELDPASDAAARHWQSRFPDAIPPCVLIVADGQPAPRHEVLAARELMSWQGGHQGSVAAIEFHGESALTAAVSRVGVSTANSVVYAIGGHGELDPDDDAPDSRRGIGLLKQRLAAAGIDLRPLKLAAVDGIPTDAAGLMIAGPNRPYEPDELGKLRQYLARGGKGLFLLDRMPAHAPEQRNAATLEELLLESGVMLGYDFIVTRGITGRHDVASPALPASGDHPLVRTLSSSTLTLFDCRSVRSRLGVNLPQTEVTPLLLSHPAPRAWAETELDATGEPQPDGPHDLAGPVAMAVAVEDMRGKAHEPLFVVCGDAEFAANDALTGPGGPSGYHFLLSSLNWLCHRKTTLADIRSQRRAAYVLTGTLADQRGLVWKPALLLSALIVTAGATVWTIRRV